MMTIENDPNRGERLKLFIKRQFLKDNRFAKKVGISSNYLSQMLNGHRPITYAKAMQMKIAFTQLNVEWLLHGAGEMFIDDVPVQKNLAEPEAEYQRSASGSGEKMVVDATELIRRMDFMQAEIWRLRERMKALEDRAAGSWERDAE